MEKNLILWVALLIGTVAVVIGWQLRNSALKLTRNGLRTTGTVVSRVSKSTLSMRTSTYKQVRFVTSRGQEILIDSRASSIPGAKEVGQVVPVIYDPEKPQNGVIDTFVEVQMPWIISGVTGLLIIVVNGCLLLYRLK